MNKRKRAGSVASRQDDDDSDDESLLEMATPSAGARKKKKLDPTEQCQHLYETLRNFKKDDGTSICDTFIRAPKRRQEPSYYDVVSNPIDLLKVQHKMKSDAYDDLEEFSDDIELIVNNAKAFYKQGTPEYQDACTLWDVFQKSKKKLEEDEFNLPRKIERRGRKSANNDDEESDNETDSEVYEDLFVTIMNATDPMDNRQLNTQFQLLPSKKLYPDYYDVIDHPIDLKFIANKIQTSAYTCINDMEKDLFQMTKNACTFNEPGSQIYKDAKALRKIFMARKMEIESGKYKKIPMKKSKSPQSLSATIAALREAHESSDEDDDAMESEGDGPLWQLFDQLYNTANTNDTNNTGAPLGESLWKLPNRRFHPEYYEKIKQPISMSQVRHKLKRGHYSNITDMTADLYQMLDNAKKAFLPTNKVYKDAVKMTKILNQRLVDTGDLDESDTEDTDSSSLPSVVTPVVVGEKRKKGRPRINPLPTTSPGISNVTSTPVPKGRPPNSFNLKKKLAILQQFLTEFSVNNRRPMELFMEKPSKKIYPDYYQVIQHPIDMNMIADNIKAERYTNLDDIVGDYRLMFSNCRKYNEEGSMIYEDANMLERALNEKLKEFSRDSRRLTPKSGVKRKLANPNDGKLRQLYDAIRDYREPKQSRQLALIFMKLPSKNDYPDYYDIIKQPIDMEKIAHKLKQQGYDTIDELAADFNLMFDNACKYNEPDSQIYKDALCLQQVCLQTKQLLKCNEDSVPDIQQAVQEILLLLFTSFYNFQDEEGRCFSDSLAELPEYDESEGVKIRGISLDLIKRRLDKGLYKRLDQFQEDIFQCLERARKLSRTDSQVFEDSIEMQSFFIKKRDELCKNGDILQSPALSYTAMHLSASVEALRQSKLLQEEETENESDSMTPQNGESMTIDQKVFSPGDFVYYELPDNKIPGIIFIERLWTNQENVKMCYGNVFFRPYETYHVQTRRFMEQEVFKTEQHQAVPLSQLQSKCYVMNIKEYFKMKPEGFADKDVYVCESRYSSRARSFKKIKNWLCAQNNPVKLVPRETPLEIKRVMSVFKDRVEKHKVELAELQLQEALTEKEKPNVVVFASGGEEGNTYYEQYNTVCSGVVKTGDFVYVATESGKQSIAQIHSIWETKSGKSFFRGPWLLTPPEVPGTISQKFYRQEVLLSTVQETTPTVGIVGRCAVLEQLDYCTKRPTEIAESDVYMCESIFDEMKKQIKKMQTLNGLNKFTHTQMVTPDEIYRFPRPINFARVSCGEIVALQENRPIPSSDMDIKTEGDILGIVDDSIDGPPSIGSDIATASPLPTPTTHFTASATPVTTGGGRRTGKGSRRLVTGYILYSSEHRKSICASNPEASFGDISRMVGLEWKALPEETRRLWEEKASKLNEENAIKHAEANALANESGCSSPVPERAQPATIVQEILPNQVYECCWDKCDYQFEDPADLMEHCIADSIGCIHKKIQSEADYICIWRGCVRLRRSAPPFPSIARLVKHVRDVHVSKNTGRIVEPYNRSKNYMASKRQSVQQPIQTTIQTIQTQATNTIIGTNLTTSQTILASQNVAPNNHVNNSSVFNPEPLFVTVPPRPQRVLHSEAYLKYIEGLNSNTPHITPWEKTLKATKETISNMDVSRLPTHWLGKRGKEKPEEVVDAIWQLREFMMKDVIKFNQY